MDDLKFAKKYIITERLVQQMIIFVIASFGQMYMRGTATVFQHGKNDNIA